MTIKQQRSARLAGADQGLVNLLASVLVDPNVHTDTRMRLHQERGEILAGVEGESVLSGRPTPPG